MGGNASKAKRSNGTIPPKKKVSFAEGVVDNSGKPVLHKLRQERSANQDQDDGWLLTCLARLFCVPLPNKKKQLKKLDETVSLLQAGKIGREP